MSRSNEGKREPHRHPRRLAVGTARPAVTVDYTTVDGTGADAATAPADYTATAGTLVFSPANEPA